MTFGLDFNKLLVIGVIAVLLVGPDRLPRYAEALARFIRRAGEMLRGAKDRVSEEMGTEFEDTDWRKLDPRQYDPRRIIREALLEEPAPAVAVAGGGAAAASAMAASTVREPLPRLRGGELPPFDAEAT